MNEEEFIGIIGGISGEAIAKEVKKLGYRTYVISGREEDSGMNCSDKKLIIDLKEKEIIYKNLLDNKVDKIIFGTGHILAFKLAEFLANKGIKVSINPTSSLIAKDKFLYKKEMEKNKILTPLYIKIELNEKYNLNEIFLKIGCPCVIKSTIDTIYPKKANTKEEIKEYIECVLKTNSTVVIEQFIEGIDTTIPVYSNLKEIKAVLVSYYSKSKSCKLEGFNDNIVFSKLSLEKEKELLKFTEEVIKKTGIIGMARLDVIVGKDNKFYVLECNSVMVTGIHKNQLEYGKEFLEKEKINFAELTVKNAFKIFGIR